MAETDMKTAQPQTGNPRLKLEDRTIFTIPGRARFNAIYLGPEFRRGSIWHRFVEVRTGGVDTNAYSHLLSQNLMDQAEYKNMESATREIIIQGANGEARFEVLHCMSPPAERLENGKSVRFDVYAGAQKALGRYEETPVVMASVK